MLLFCMPPQKRADADKQIHEYTDCVATFVVYMSGGVQVAVPRICVCRCWTYVCVHICVHVYLSVCALGCMYAYAVVYVDTVRLGYP